MICSAIQLVVRPPVVQEEIKEEMSERSLLGPFDRKGGVPGIPDIKSSPTNEEEVLLGSEQPGTSVAWLGMDARMAQQSQAELFGATAM